MPYVNRELLRLSLEALKQYNSSLAIISLPCMFQQGLPTCNTAAEAQEAAIPFGATHERAWLEEYYTVPGGPPDKPYYMPGTGEWVQQRYADRSLQRRRKDFEDSIFFHPDQKRWALRPHAAEVVASRIIQDKPPIPLVALMAWMWRHREITDLGSALKDFVAELGLNRDGFIGPVFTDEIPKEFSEAGLASKPLDPAEVADLTGASHPQAPIAPVIDLVVRLRDSVQSDFFVTDANLIERIISGWLTQDIVVLVGPTGSGKTQLAVRLGRALEKALGDDHFFFKFLEITPDTDLSQFLGYENLAGEFTAGSFAREVLFEGDAGDPRLVILDEWNLAKIDAYFAPILSAVETGAPLRLPGQIRLEGRELEDLKRSQPDAQDGRWRLPEDTFFLATCNSWAEEPDTRLPISGPVKRRCRIIPMPNLLAERFAREGRDGIAQFCSTLLAQERQAVQTRIEVGRGSLLDAHRADRLNSIQTFEDLDENTRNQLVTLARILLENAQTRNVVTPGILKDLLLACVYASGDAAYSVLGQQVTDKLLPQIQGDPHILSVIHESTRDFPNADEIAMLIKQMGGLAGQRRIRPLI